MNHTVLLKFVMGLLGILGLLTHAVAAESNDCDTEHSNRRASVYWENDSLASLVGGRPSDKWYTNGLKLVYSYADGCAMSHTKMMQTAASGIAKQFDLFNDEARHGVVIGQLMFTPKNIAISAPQPNDRYYGGWLYFGHIIQSDSSAIKTSTGELDVGIVGPYSYAGQVQTFVHGQMLHVTLPAGWDHQIRGEPGIQLSYNQIEKIPKTVTAFSDASFYRGAVVGTVFDNVKGGLVFRLGSNLESIPVSIIESPLISSNKWQRHGAYMLLRTEVQGVLHNTFIDGSFFRSAPFQSNVKRKPIVAQATLGLVKEGVFDGDAKLSFLLTRRTAEFTSPEFGAGTLFTYGTLNLEWPI